MRVQGAGVTSEDAVDKNQVVVGGNPGRGGGGDAGNVMRELV